VEVSAYTSRQEETDASPCTGADNTNICEFSGCAIATNDYPLGSILNLEKFGKCTVKDRMNARYTGRGNIDVYMGTDLKKALEFGRQNLKIKLLKS
jgi:3D (Asp-Asp-Asp) domain-containing protein